MPKFVCSIPRVSHADGFVLLSRLPTRATCRHPWRRHHATGGALSAIGSVVGPVGAERAAPDDNSLTPNPVLAAPTAERRLISQLLAHFKQTAEVRQYLKWFGSSGRQFAIVKISGDIMKNGAETARVASALAFLHRIGLVPIVVHGAGLFTGRRAGAVAAAATSGDPSALSAAAHRHMHSANAALVAALAVEGVAAEPMVGNVFSAEAASGFGDGGAAAVAADTEARGRITGVDESALLTALAASRIPVVAAFSGGGGGNASSARPFLTFPTQEACVALSRAVRPLKVIVLRPEGGLRCAATGATVRALDLGDDAAAAAEQPPQLSAVDAALLPQMRELYAAMTAPSSGAGGDAAGGGGAGGGGATVSVTAPEFLADEIFLQSSRGGTVGLRRERILAFDSLMGAEGEEGQRAVDLARVGALIQEAFGAQLPDDFFASLIVSPAAAPADGAPPTRRLRRLYVSECYRGVAVVTEEAGLPGVAYLDKFAVSPSAQGDKLGEVLWRAMAEREGPLYWRSRATNRVNGWYYEQSSGCYKAPAGDWTVFWRGLAREQVMPAVAAALALPPTFARRVYPQQPDAGEAGASAWARQPIEQPQLK